MSFHPCGLEDKHCTSKYKKVFYWKYIFINFELDNGIEYLRYWSSLILLTYKILNVTNAYVLESYKTFISLY